MVVFVFLWNDLGMKYDLDEGCEQNLPWCFLRKLLFCVCFFQILKYDYSLFHQMFFDMPAPTTSMGNVFMSPPHMYFFFLFFQKKQNKNKKNIY